MTRKDYELIAKVLDDTRPVRPDAHATSEEIAQRQQWRCVMYRMMDELKHDNPEFDRDQFTKTCFDDVPFRVPGT